MASKLFIDILSIIFEYIEHDDRALYQCIFVNREWCRVAMPFLWKDPWKKFNGSIRSNSNLMNRYKILFKCFSMMMSKESKEFLKIKGDYLVEDTQKPLFNYASFCKIIDSNKISLMVFYNIDDCRYFTEQEILKLLISNTLKINCLILCGSYDSHPLECFPNSSISLSHLNELHCHTTIDEGTFYGLSKLCRNIERLIIEGNDDNNQGLILLIKQQINLKRVKIWERNYNNTELNIDKHHGRLGEALVTKSSSIIELDIGKSNILFPILLKNFQNSLTIFKFGMNYEIIEMELVDDELESVLKSISLPNLQQLIIYDCYYPPFDIIAKIIEKTNGDLKKIVIKSYHDCHDSSDVNMFISTITKYCPKLELLTIQIQDSSSMI